MRSGYGLASGVRRCLVPSDMFRVSRDGFVRDSVVVDKTRMLVADERRRTRERSVPAALATSVSLSEAACAT